MTDENTVTNPETNKYDMASVVGLAINDQPTEIQSTFDNAMKDAIADRLEARKIELGQEMFDLGHGPAEVEAAGDEDEAVDDDATEENDEDEEELSDEEWDQLINSLEDEEATVEEPETDDSNEEV